jgi:hypothetical protein
MFTKIYANGCSFTKAGGLDQLGIRKKYKKILNIDLNDDYIQYAYPNIVSKKLKVPIDNQAVSGGSVNRLIRKTYEYVYKNQSTISETLFILELPTMWRDEIYSNYLDRTMNITTGIIDSHSGIDKELLKNLQSYFYNFVNIEFDYKKTMNNLLGLMYFLKYNNLNVILLDNANFEKFLKNNKLKYDFKFVSFVDKTMH